jgi:hypothetical protein
LASRVTGFAHRRIAAAKPSSHAFALIIALFAFVMAATAILLAYRQTAGGIALAHSRQAPPDAGQQFSSCIDGTFKTIRVSAPDTATYTAVWRLCGEQIYDIDALNDFAIRKEKFTQQELDERVILFLVVAITLSGVCLAGLQLLVSYKLASRRRVNFTEDSTLSLEHDKVSLRSSVTGLMILVVSLGFFIIYVKWVYTIREVGIEPPPALSQDVPAGLSAAGHALLSVAGGLGAPAAVGSPPSANAPSGSPPNRLQAHQRE